MHHTAAATATGLLRFNIDPYRIDCVPDIAGGVPLGDDGLGDTAAVGRARQHEIRAAGSRTPELIELSPRMTRPIVSKLRPSQVRPLSVDTSTRLISASPAHANPEMRTADPRPATELVAGVVMIDFTGRFRGNMSAAGTDRPARRAGEDSDTRPERMGRHGRRRSPGYA